MKMSAKENGLEVKVGFFVCVGLLIIGAMILEFGLGGKQGLFRKYYPLVVELPDANGLLKNSEVQLAGARVGYVVDKPVLSSNLNTVRVTLNIDENVKIPVGFYFEVESSGLLGDKYVEIIAKGGFDAKKFNPSDESQIYLPAEQGTPNSGAKVYDPANPEQNPENGKPLYARGDIIMGVHKPSLTDVVSEAEPAVKKLSVELDDLRSVTDSLKTGVLSDASQKNLEDTFAGLKTTSQEWAQASSNLPSLAKNAQDAVDKATQTLGTANTTLETVRALVDKASHGEGLIGQLVNNKQLADNFNALIINLRDHGILFYKNTAGGNSPSSRDKKDH